MREFLRKRRSLLAAALFAASVFIAAFKVATPANFDVTVGVGGQIVVTEIPRVYSLVDVIAVLAFAFLAGATGMHLVRGERSSPATASVARAAKDADNSPSPSGPDATALVSRLLEGETRNVYLAVLRHGGDVLQRDLVLETGLPKATVSRALATLSEKGLIQRSPQGMTNRIMVVRTLDAVLAR